MMAETNEKRPHILVTTNRGSRTMPGLNWRIQNIQYRSRLLWKIIMNFCGYCPKCYNRVNWDRNGRALCPNCKR